MVGLPEETEKDVLDIVSLLMKLTPLPSRTIGEAAYMPQWLPLFLNPLHRSSGNVKYHLKNAREIYPYSETLEETG